MKNKITPLLIFLSLLILFLNSSNAQTDINSIEVYLMDAYAKPELPHTFYLSYFTSDACKSSVILDDRYSFPVSEELSDLHKTEIELTDLKFKNKIVQFVIVTEDSSGNEFISEVFDFDLPYEPVIEGGSDLFQLCLFGGMIFLLPYPDLVITNGQNYFALTKEIPVLSFRSKSLNYPSGYFSLEYSYIFKAEQKNYLRAGYKRFFEIPWIKYISPGITAYTNFLGNNGFGIETSAGFFSIADTFTLYLRYRYNLKPEDSSINFHEVTLGLYSGFFSIYLN